MANKKRRNVVKGIAAATAISLIKPGTLFSQGRGPTAVVVGSGIAGLSAAWELKQSGFRVTVFEKQHKAGGRMRQDWIGPTYGAVHAVGLWTGNKQMWDLAEDLGLGSELQDQPIYPIYGVTLNNGHASYQTSPTFDLANLTQIPGMSDETKGRLASLVPDLEEITQSGADPCLLHTCANFDDESTWDYFARKLGRTGAREFIDYWYQQMWLDVWSWKAETSSRMATLPFVAQSNDKHWISPNAGIDLLVRELATRLDVQVNTTVQRISPPNTQGMHTVHYLSATGERLSVTPDVAVCAVEGNYVLPMVEGLSDQEKEFFEQLHMLQYYSVQYILKAGTGPAEPAGNDYVVGEAPTPNHPHSEKKLGTWTVIPSDPSDYQQRPSLWYSMDSSRANEMRASGQDIADFCLPLVQQSYPNISADNIGDVVVRSGDYLIHVPTGLAREVSRFHQMQNRERRSLYFTGEYLGHAHTGGACAGGRFVGRNIARHWA